MNEEEKKVLSILKQTTQAAYEKMSAEEKRAFGEKTRMREHPIYVAYRLAMWHSNLPYHSDDEMIESWKLYCPKGAWN